jgi:methyl-accepting chemotaxis protein
MSSYVTNKLKMNRFVKSSISVKVQIAVQSTFLLVSIAQTIYSYNSERNARVEAEKVMVRTLANGVIHGANMLMLNGNVNDIAQRKLFIQKMGSSEDVKSLRLIRNKLVQVQYGQGLPEEQPVGEEELQALEDGKQSFEERGDVLHAIIPYTASKNYKGTNCLTCHNVPEGYHNGASVIDLDISATNADLHRLTIASIIQIIVSQIIFLIVINFILNRFVSKPVNEIKSAIVELSNNNDFTRRVSVNSVDEIGQAAQSFNVLMENLQAVFRQMHEGIEKVAESSASLSSYSEQVAEGSAGQSQATSVMAATVSQVTFGTSMVSAGASEASRLSSESTAISEKGGEIIHRAAEEMMKIAESVRQTSGSIASLGEQSDEISSIVNVIKEIADQTNLLALNAAIEAARAGEQGRGFAVVADEVRKLAERTAKATQQVTVMIEGIQSSSHSVVESMTGMVSKAEVGVALAREAGEAISEIKSGTDQVTSYVRDISNSLEEQGKASDEIGAEIDKVSQMTEANSTAAKQASAAASDLAQLANEMRVAVEKFKV